jgi:hypothetical protein
MEITAEHVRALDEYTTKKYLKGALQAMEEGKHALAATLAYEALDYLDELVRERDGIDPR